MDVVTRRRPGLPRTTGDPTTVVPVMPTVEQPKLGVACPTVRRRVIVLPPSGRQPERWGRRGHLKSREPLPCRRRCSLSRVRLSPCRFRQWPLAAAGRASAVQFICLSTPRRPRLRAVSAVVGERVGRWEWGRRGVTTFPPSVARGAGATALWTSLWRLASQADGSFRRRVVACGLTATVGAVWRRRDGSTTLTAACLHVPVGQCCRKATLSKMR